MPLNSNAPLTGACACKALTYRLLDTPMFTHCCHCRQCQRLTGSGFVINTIIENDNIELVSGEVVMTPGPSEESAIHNIYRCATCSTAVWSDYGGRPNYRFVRAGTLDDPGAITPDVHIFTRFKVPWVVIPPEHRQFDMFYQLEQEWPSEMLARRKRAVGG